ncbi:MAG: citrate synthase [Sandaracinaceae bacterium]
MSERRSGLEGVTVADTELSSVDGAAGQLVIRGHAVEELAGHVSFEAVTGLLFDGALASDTTARRDALGRARAEAFAMLPRLGDALDRPGGMDALRAGLAHATEADGPWPTSAIAVSGAVAVIAAAWARRRARLEPVAPDPTIGHAHDYLRMALGRDVHPSWSDALDAYLVTVVDHGMNASTFAARVIASTESDLVSSVVGAVGALKGRLHGGAPGPVLDMLDAIGTAERAEAWLAGELAAGRRIMGMGHRVYRIRDPRAAVLEAALERLARSGHASGRLALARAVETKAVAALAAHKPDRPLRANVEFYTATLLEALDLPRELFTPTFAVGRVVGWCAHVHEQRTHGRLIRPASRYVGPAPTQRASA